MNRIRAVFINISGLAMITAGNSGYLDSEWVFVWDISAVADKKSKYFGKMRVKEVKGSINAVSECINISLRSLIIKLEATHILGC